MDLGDSEGGFDAGAQGLPPKPKALPDDLPRSLDDRRRVPTELVPETEMYDGWQGWFPPFATLLSPPVLIPFSDCDRG